MSQDSFEEALTPTITTCYKTLIFQESRSWHLSEASPLGFLCDAHTLFLHCPAIHCCSWSLKESRGTQEFQSMSDCCARQTSGPTELECFKVRPVPAESKQAFYPLWPKRVLQSQRSLSTRGHLAPHCHVSLPKEKGEESSSKFFCFLNRTDHQYIFHGVQPSMDHLTSRRIQVHLIVPQVIFYYTIVRGKLAANCNNCYSAIFSD